MSRFDLVGNLKNHAEPLLASLTAGSLVYVLFFANYNDPNSNLASKVPKAPVVDTVNMPEPCVSPNDLSQAVLAMEQEADNHDSMTARKIRVARVPNLAELQEIIVGTNEYTHKPEVQEMCRVGEDNYIAVIQSTPVTIK